MSANHTRFSIRSRNWDDFRNITVFDRSAGQLISVEYPMTLSCLPIMPSGIGRWMARRGLVWECECARFEDQLCAIRWTTAPQPMGMCTKNPPQCALRINLERVLQTADRYSSYQHIPTLRSRQSNLLRAGRNEPALRRYERAARRLRLIRTNFRTSNRNTGNILSRFSLVNPRMRPLDRARARARHLPPTPVPSPPANQLSLRRRSSTSSASNSTGTTAPPPYSPFNPHNEPSNASTTRPIFSSSLMANTLLGVDRLKELPDEELTEQEIYMKILLSGEGITTYQFLDLLKKCESCEQNFLEFYFDEHLVQ